MIAEEEERPGYLGYLITFETAAKHQDLYQVMLGSKGSALITHRVANYLAAAIRQGIEAGSYMSEFGLPPDILAQYAVGALMRLTLWWLETPNEYTLKEMADMLYLVIHRDEAAIEDQNPENRLLMFAVSNPLLVIERVRMTF